MKNQKQFLSETHPEIARQWHPDKNADLTPDVTRLSSDKIVWWKCDNGDDHEWEAMVKARTKKNGTGCPVCSNLKIVPSNCLATTHPEIAQQWHLTKNSVNSNEIGAGSERKIWWKCDKGDDHEWEVSPSNRTQRGVSGCPICSNQKIVPSNCLVTTHPKIAHQWHPTKNKLSPHEVGSGSAVKVWWQCDNGDDHEWVARIVDRTKKNGSGCTICKNRKIIKSNCLATSHPIIASQWHKIKNEITPYDVPAGSSKKVWWKCDKGDDHEWETIISARTKPNGTGCPVCTKMKIVPSNCLSTTHPEIIKQWHQTKNTLTPYHPMPG